MRGREGEMRGREEGEEGWEEGEGRKKGGGEKRKILRARSAHRSRREEGDKGWEGEVRGREGERPTPCPPPPICNYSVHNSELTLMFHTSIYTLS